MCSKKTSKSANRALKTTFYHSTQNIIRCLCLLTPCNKWNAIISFYIRKYDVCIIRCLELSNRLIISYDNLMSLDPDADGIHF